MLLLQAICLLNKDVKHFSIWHNQGCALGMIQLAIFLNGGVQSVQYEGHRITSLHFACDVVQLASPVHIRNESLLLVKLFQYLGVLFTGEDIDRTSNRRIGAAMAALLYYNGE